MNLEFGYCVHRRHDDHTTTATAVIVLAAVNQIHVVVGTHAVERNGTVRAHGYGFVEVRHFRGSTGRQRRQLEEVPPVDSQLCYLLAGNHITNLTRFTLDFDHFFRDVHIFCDFAHLHGNVDPQSVAYVQYNASALVGFEALFLGLN